MIKPIRKPALWPYLKSSSCSYSQTFCFNSGLEISFDFRVLWIREVILSWNFSSRTTILLWSSSNKKRNLGPFYVWNSYLKHGSWQRTLNNAIRLFICLTIVPPFLVGFRLHLIRTVQSWKFLILSSVILSLKSMNWSTFDTKLINDSAINVGKILKS